MGDSRSRWYENKESAKGAAGKYSNCWNKTKQTTDIFKFSVFCVFLQFHILDKYNFPTLILIPGC